MVHYGLPGNAKLCQLFYSLPLKYPFGLSCNPPQHGKEHVTKPSTLFSPINKTFQIKNLNSYELSVYTSIINGSLLI